MLKHIEDLLHTRCEAQLGAAVAAYCKAHPNKTEEEIQRFREVALANMTSSASKTKLLNSKAMRQARKVILSSLLQEHQLVVIEFPLIPFPEDIMDESLEDLGSMDFQKVTAVLKYDYSVEKTVHLKASFTFHNPKDEFDSLVGNEQATERFINRQYISVNSSAKDFAYGVLDNGRLSRLALVYKQEFLKQQSPVGQNISMTA